MKTCTTCKMPKQLEDYNRNSASKDGRQTRCRKCTSQWHREKNAMKRSTSPFPPNVTPHCVSKHCKGCNKRKMFFEYGVNKSSKFNKQSACKKCMREYDRNYSKENKEELRRKAIEHYRKNKKDINLRNKRRRKQDPLFRLRQIVRCRIWGAYSNKGFSEKSLKTLNMLKCDWPTLYRHLQLSFEANYGIPSEYMESFDYHVDHIIPLNSATTEEEIIKLNHYTNLQILLAEDNLRKSDRLDWELN